MSFKISPSCTGCTACVRICPVEAISGERKLLHVIDSTMCIDCGACGRICPVDAIFDQDGAQCRMVKRSHWQKPMVVAKKCISCGVCLEVCPTGVLDFDGDVNGAGHTVAYLRDAGNCIGCAYCEIACPVEAIVMNTPGAIKK